MECAVPSPGGRGLGPTLSRLSTKSEVRASRACFAASAGEPQASTPTDCFTQECTSHLGFGLEEVTEGAHGLKSVEIRVPTVDDSIKEPDETFELTLNNSGAYELKNPKSATAAILDDDNDGKPYVDTIPEDTSTSAIVSVDGSVKGDLETRDDVDWRGPSLTEGQCYRIQLYGKYSETGPTLAEPLITRVYRDDGSSIRGTMGLDIGTGPAEVLLRPDATGTYYIAVEQSFRSGSHPDGGSYRLSLEDLGSESTECGNREDSSAPAIEASIKDVKRLESLNSGSGLHRMTFRVILDNSSKDRVLVDYATSDGTAEAGKDYTAVSGTLWFEPGETNKGIQVDILPDELEDEGTETFLMTLSIPNGVTIVDGKATGKIEEQ